MSNLMGNDVGLGEVPRRTEAIAKLVEKAQVQIDFLISRAIERSHGGIRKSTGGLHFASEKMELGFRVRFSHFSEFGIPDVFGVRQDDPAKADQLVLLRIGNCRPAIVIARRLGLLDLVQKLLWVAAQQPGQKQEDYHADSATHGRSLRSHHAGVFDILTFALTFPLHSSSPKWFLSVEASARREKVQGL
jgi:hypothetical protein